MRLLGIALAIGLSTGLAQQDRPVKILKGHDWSVTALDINKTGDLLLSGGWDNSMIMWNLSGDSMLYRFKNHSDMIWAVAFSPDEQYVASASWDASINLWDTETKELVHKFTHAQTFRQTQTESFARERMVPNMINTLAFHPDGSLLASGSSDGMIRIWDLASGQLKELIDIHGSTSVNQVLFNQSGNNLISSSDKILIYDLKSGKIEMQLDGHHGQLICALDMDNSGKYLISGDIAVRDPLIHLWDLRTGKKIRTYRGHEKIIRDIAFSNDGSMIASVGEDNLIMLWSLNSGNAISSYSDHDGKELNAVCFTRDDQMIIYASQDKTIKFVSMMHHRGSK